MMHILIVDDNQDLAANIIDYLTIKGCTLDYAANGKQALDLNNDHSYDAIVLDITMPGINGLEVCRKLRSEQQKTPILFLTARDTLDEKIEGFDAGGDDYLIKPFAMSELYARLNSLGKRVAKSANPMLRVADLTLNIQSSEVTRNGQIIALNPSCTKLLHCLMQHSPNTVSRQALSYSLWGNHGSKQDILRSHLYLLRNAIDKPFNTPLLHTVHGIGFCLKEEACE